MEESGLIIFMSLLHGRIWFNYIACITGYFGIYIINTFNFYCRSFNEIQFFCWSGHSDVFHCPIWLIVILPACMIGLWFLDLYLTLTTSFPIIFIFIFSLLIFLNFLHLYSSHLIVFLTYYDFVKKTLSMGESDKYFVEQSFHKMTKS